MSANSKSIAAFAAACVCLSVLLFWIRAVSIPVALAGLAIVWLSMLPAFLYLAKGDFSVVPFFPMVGAFYLVFFGISVFVFQFNDFARVPEAYDTPLVMRIRVEPLLLVVAGLAAQIAAFIVGQRIIFAKIKPLSIRGVSEPHRISLLLFMLTIGHFAHRYFPQLQSVPSIGQFLEPGGYVAYAGLLLLRFRNDLNRIEEICLFAVALPLEIYMRVKTIFLTDILLFSIGAIFILWKARRFKALFLIAMLSIVILSGYGATSAVRDPMASRLVNFDNIVEAYVNATILGKSNITNVEGVSVPVKGRFASLIQRTAHIWIFHMVYDRTPRDMPYWGGETYLPLMTSLIPRIFYPDKPQERAGLEFGVSYELIAPNSLTSVNIPWITELLMNFGPVGVLLGMAVFGLLFAFLDRVFNAPEIGITEFAIGLPMLLKFVYPESNFSVTVGSLPILFVVLYCYFRFGELALSRIGVSKSSRPQRD